MFYIEALLLYIKASICFVDAYLLYYQDKRIMSTVSENQYNSYMNEIALLKLNRSKQLMIED